MSKFNELVTKLREIFQIDRPELDFGVYRILNARADEINEYLEKRLKEKVEEALASGSAANLEQLKEELKKAEQGAQALGVDADTVPKVQELKAKISEATSGSAEHENAVFSHLLTFFSRYYDQGDFISQRRYKGDTYAIPYAGEEVMLHWANKDQYYIKTGENFSNYSFKLDDGRVVHFRLVSADTAKDNRKDNDKERRFVLAEHKVISRLDDDGDEYEEEVLPVEEVLTTDAEGNETKELIIRFEYKVMPKGSKQDKLVEAAVESVLANEAVANRWLDIGRRAPTEKKPKRTLLEKQLTNYTTKNTADYFIHKNLGKFLRLELDFYIKNEVMHLDDVQNSEVFSDIEKSLRMIQCLRGIALDLIKFLAQLEDFQKKLWTKKKFVISSHYSITLDRIPEELYEDIMANEKQWNHWKRLGSWDGSQKTMSELLSNKYRMVDTGLFDNSFKSRLLASLSNIDSELDGLLIHGDNFQGISSLKGGWENSVSAIYIDPPYNTDASPIVYKNGYQHSTWASLFFGRMSSALDLLKEGSLVCVAIDDFEYPHQYLMMNDALGLNHIGTAAVRSKPQGRPTASGFSTNHEYAVFWSATEKPALGRMPREGTKANRYPFSDDKGVFSWANFRKSGSDSNREDRKRSFYPVYVEEDSVRVPEMVWNTEQEIWIIEEEPLQNEVAVWPIDANGNEKVWTCASDRLRRELADVKVIKNKDGSIELQKKYRPNQQGALPGTWWDNAKYSASESGTKVIKDQFNRKDFDFPKSVNLVIDNLRVLNIQDGEAVLDYFAGSGTTGCAVIALNREDGGNRKYVLIEQGEYFETILKPRIEKNVYSSEWKNGQPVALDSGISHSFKVLKLESYEDTLNNISLERTQQQQDLLDSEEVLNEDYLLNYMLEAESKQSLLSIDDFKKPFHYSMNITIDSAGAFQKQKVDLVETFNFLIGLTVKQIDAQPERGFVTVAGTLPTGESCLVFWRDCDLIDYEGLNKLCDKLAINPADNEFDVVYINGDHNIPTVLTQTAEEGGETRGLKLRQIEPEFLDRMFAEEDV